MAKSKFLTVLKMHGKYTQYCYVLVLPFRFMAVLNFLHYIGKAQKGQFP
jgi:hypothetical protein